MWRIIFLPQRVIQLAHSKEKVRHASGVGILEKPFKSMELCFEDLVDLGDAAL